VRIYAGVPIPHRLSGGWAANGEFSCPDVGGKSATSSIGYSRLPLVCECLVLVSNHFPVSRGRSFDTDIYSEIFFGSIFLSFASKDVLCFLQFFFKFIGLCQ
jgi:hypothetical protein